MPLLITSRIERYLTAPEQLIYNQKFRAECIRSWFLQQTAKLYKRYGLSKDEIAFIESQVAEHDSELFEEVGADEVKDD